MCERNRPLVLLLTTEKTSTVGDHVYLADYDDRRRIRHVGSQLTCFHAGNWLLGIIIYRRFSFRAETNWSGGKLANNDTIVDIGLQLNDACWNTYAGDAYVFSSPHTANALSSYQDRYRARGIRIYFRGRGLHRL